MEVYFTGTIERIIFENVSNFYRILLLDIEDTNAEDFDDFEIIVTGTMADVIEGEEYTFWGQIVQHSKYGEQLQISRYENDKLYINNQETDEPYLADYLKRFKEDKLQSTYTGEGWDGKKGEYFRSIAEKAQAFTLDVNYNTSFTFTVPEGQYLLLGDDRLVSSDSRHVGTFKAKDIIGEAKFRFWPLKRIGTV